VINIRLLRELEIKGLLHDSQNGFRKGRNCTDHVLTLQQALLGRVREGKSTFLLETDFFKAYDTVSREGLFFRLWEAGVRGKMWRVIRDMYANTTCVALHNGWASSEEGFQIDLGLAQGDPLSTTLYLVYINPLLEELAKRPGVALGEGNTLSSLAYADDNTAIAESAAELDNIIKVIQDYCCKWRIRVNQGKCKVMVVGPDYKKCQRKHQKGKLVWKWGEFSLPLVEDTKYLGTVLHHTLSTDAHFEQVLEKAKTKALKLTGVLRNKNVNLELKVLLLKTIILPILEYGSEVLVPSSAMAAKLQSFWSGLQRKLVGVHNKTTGVLVAAELGLTSLQTGRDQRRLGYARRLQGMDESRLPKVVTSVKWGSVGAGAKKQLWAKQLETLQQHRGIDTDFFTLHAEDSKKAFGRTVKDLLIANDLELLQEEAEEKSTVRAYLNLAALPNFPAKQVQPYLMGGRTLGKSLLLQCRCRSLPLGCRTCRWEAPGRTRASREEAVGVAKGNCKMCIAAPTETDAHFVLLCPAYELLPQGHGRGAFKEDLKQLLGPARFGQWVAEAPEDQLEQLLGYHWGEESRDVHKLLARFLEAAWTYRRDVDGGGIGDEGSTRTRDTVATVFRGSGVPGHAVNTCPESRRGHAESREVANGGSWGVGERFSGSGFLSKIPTGPSNGPVASASGQCSAPFGGRVVNGCSATARP
jgi:hypothetical protein